MESFVEGGEKVVLMVVVVVVGCFLLRLTMQKAVRVQLTAYSKGTSRERKLAAVQDAHHHHRRTPISSRSSCHTFIPSL